MQNYQWIPASTRLPEGTNGYAKQIVTRWHFIDNVQLRVTTANEFLQVAKHMLDLDKVEWMEDSEPTDLQKQLTQLKEINAQLLVALKEVVRLSDRNHDAWNYSKAVIAKAETGQPSKKENDPIMEDALFLALEFGYKQCEKGNNIQMAFSNYNKVKAGK